jgi:Polyketide cyclase / dehydrase and lipid transport
MPWATMSQRVVLTSRWRLDAPAAAVWPLLTDIESWPSWWPYVRRVRLVERAPSSPQGDVAELVWRTALLYGICVRVTTTAFEAPSRLEGRAEGDLTGFGAWLLEPVDAYGVDITYRWELLLERRWMRVLSFLLRPLFEWNHFVVMRAGAQGMAQRLGCRVSQRREWSGSRWP